ncbi:MAG: NirD/YgiW/YdeI family stress tolerance protein [Desulfovibrio sp.]|nr:NirD/YgiW/YdeI family stress tolerance protein [Desulfovibrio sp.]
MKRLMTLAILAALALAPLSAQAAFKDQAAPTLEAGIFSGPISGAMAETDASARELQDDAPVVLTGHLLSRVAGSKDKFVFKDGTGEIRVKIGKKAMAGLNITPEDKVRISGKVDKDFGKEVRIKAARVEIVK